MKRLLLLLAFAGVTLLPACHKPDDPAGTGEKPAEPLYLQGLTLSVDTLFLKVGESATVKGTVIPEELSSEARIHWTSFSEDIVSVDDNGRVTALDYGAATLEATAQNGEYQFKYCRLPVYVSFPDSPIRNPEEAYRKWLGRWQLAGNVYRPIYSGTPEVERGTIDYYASYVIAVSVLEPMESYRIVGWEQFLGPSDSPPYPGEPLLLTARFDRKTGNLVYFRNPSERVGQSNFVMSPYWYGSPYGKYGYYYRSPNEGVSVHYPCPDDVVIAYAHFEEGEAEKRAVVRGAYHHIEDSWYYHLGMGFANQDGVQLDKPMYFPLRMFRMSDVAVEEITLSESTLVMETGTEADLSAEWKPSESTAYEKVKWSSSNPAVVSVTDDGHLEARSLGRAVVKASLGGVSAGCEVTVKKPFIHFYCPWLRDRLCERWDTDGDGELCVEEAAAATSIGNHEEVVIYYFDELRYFTSVKELEPRCLSNTSLFNITIPANIERIGAGAFDRDFLYNVMFLGKPPVLGKGALGDPDRDVNEWVHYWVPDEYYDLYIEEARKEDSTWAPYLSRIFRVSEREDWEYANYL